MTIALIVFAYKYLLIFLLFYDLPLQGRLKELLQQLKITASDLFCGYRLDLIVNSL